MFGRRRILLVGRPSGFDLGGDVLLGAVDLGFDPIPNVRRRFDGLDHDVELAQPALPHAHDLGKARIDHEQRLGLIALVGGERSQDIFGGKSIPIVVVHRYLKRFFSSTIMLLIVSMILSDLASPAEAGFAKAGNRYPLFGIMLGLPYTREFRGDCGEARF